MMQITERFFPREISFERLCDILVGFLNIGADKSSMPANLLPSKVPLSKDKISKNLKFFRSWGLIIEDEKTHGSYRLSKEAADFASAYRVNPNSERTKVILRNFLSKQEIISQFAERLKQDASQRDDIIVELPKLIGDLTADRVGLNAFLDMVEYAYGIAMQPSQNLREKKKADRPKWTHRNMGLAVRNQAPGSVVLNITLNVDTRDQASMKNLLDLLKMLGIIETSDADSTGNSTKENG